VVKDHFLDFKYKLFSCLLISCLVISKVRNFFKIWGIFDDFNDIFNHFLNINFLISNKNIAFDIKNIQSLKSVF